MKEKRGTLGGEKDNMVNSQPKKEVNIDIRSYYTQDWPFEPIILKTIITIKMKVPRNLEKTEDNLNDFQDKIQNKITEIIYKKIKELKIEIY